MIGGDGGGGVIVVSDIIRMVYQHDFWPINMTSGLSPTVLFVLPDDKAHLLKCFDIAILVLLRAIKLFNEVRKALRICGSSSGE